MCCRSRGRRACRSFAATPPARWTSWISKPAARGWIHHDRKDYWERELRRSEDAVTQARVQLQQARTSRRVADHEPACDEEKRALARAKRRHETAQRKVEAVRRWTRAIEHAVDEYQRDRLQFLAVARRRFGQRRGRTGPDGRLFGKLYFSSGADG